jgi:hypothetical protein
MRRFRFAIVLGLICGFFAKVSHAEIQLIDKDGWTFSTSGIIEFDTIADSTRSLTEVIGNAPIARGATYAGDNGRTQMSMRNSRLAFDAGAPVVNNWKTQGYLEMDFLGYDPTPSSGSPTDAAFFTNPTLRIRHAYMKADNDDFHVLVGQTWTLFGWDPYYVSATESVAPTGGTIYERTPQILVVKDIHFSDDTFLQAGASMNRPTQRDGEIPDLDLGLKLNFTGRKAAFNAPNNVTKVQPASIALSSTFREIEAPTAGGPDTSSQHYFAAAGAADIAIPLIASSDGKDGNNTLMLVAEVTIGKGYGDEFNGYTGNSSLLYTPTSVQAGNLSPNLDPGLGGFDSNGNFNLAHLETHNIQLQYHLPEGWNSFVTGGYAQFWSNNMGNFTPASASVPIYNRTQDYFVNYMHDFTPQLRGGVELLQYRVAFTDGNLAKDDRVQLSAYFFF